MSRKDILNRIRLMLKYHTNIKQFEKLINGRTVAVIGNAESIFSHAFGEEIDRHDIIIRMNRGVIKSPESQGSRTDLWISSCSENLAPEEFVMNHFFLNNNIKYWIWMTPKCANVPAYSESLMKRLLLYPFLNWYGLYRKLNSHRPSTGAMLIDYICRKTHFKKLDISASIFLRQIPFTINLA